MLVFDKYIFAYIYHYNAYLNTNVVKQILKNRILKNAVN